MPSKRNPAVYFLDMLDAIERIRMYLNGISLEQFEEDIEKQDAVNRRLSILTEAADRLRPEDKQLCSPQEWHAIQSLGNRLRHDYDSINMVKIWDIIHEELPPLKVAVEHTMRDHFPDIPLP
jgi:uncharacterized protein with HEPN domain